ncbi:MAG: alpha/beta fold hydrolase [Miltoncostaeaceae bacterium]
MIRSRISKVTMGLSVALLATLCLAATASAQSVRFSSCTGTSRVGCATLSVPLDHADPSKGEIPLHVERRRASGTRRGVVVMLAGGPGQAGTPLDPDGILPAAIPGWDYVVLDQRGTGNSALRCAALDAPQSTFSNTEIATCAAQVGPNRAFYTSRDSVLDIENLRVALGVPRIALGGVSYGTYVAQYYAQAFPDSVSHLVLDSVVDPATMSGLAPETWAAVPGMLTALCARNACSGITTNPVGDVARVVAATANAPLRGMGTTARGRMVRAEIGGPGAQGDLPGLLMLGDLSPGMRSLYPGAIHAAARGDGAPLFRLAALANSGGSPPVAELSSALFFATECADSTPPWTSADPTGVRVASLGQAFADMGDAAVAPFSIANASAASPAEGCLAWPDAATDPLSPGPLPAVPTLLFAGGQDLRTPTASARAVAARSPSAAVVVAPGWGHALSDNLDCAATQVARLLSNRTIQTGACSRVTVAINMAPFPAPAATVGALSPMGAKGNPGRVAHAARFSIQDGLHSLSAGTDAGLGGIPGVRGGFMRVSGMLGQTARFQNFSDTAGVRISGAIDAVGSHFTGRVTVDGPGSLDGYMDLAKGGARAYTGVIGGVAINIPLG